LTVGTGDLMQALTCSNSIANGSPKTPQNYNSERPGTQKANWH